jgi:hypothetical protein
MVENTSIKATAPIIFQSIEAIRAKNARESNYLHQCAQDSAHGVTENIAIEFEPKAALGGSAGNLSDTKVEERL